jgi:DNA-binding NtrC family response regulator
MAQVLIIDADDGICATLRLLLEDAGYTLTTTARPELALEQLRTSPERLVVLFDAGMPRVSEGRITALAAVDDPLLRRHTYICMTTSMALMHPDLQAALISLGVPILEKPFDLDEMLATVEQAARLAMMLPGG